VPRIVHLGLGAFHRAHQAVYTTDAGGWEICGVTRRSRAVVDALRGSGGRYTLVTRGPSSDTTRRLRLAEALVAADEPEAVVDRIADPATQIVTLTITEGGYEAGNPLLGLLARGVAAREGAPLTVLSCDNVPRNGEATRAIVGDHPAVAFRSTIADRITPHTEDPLVVVTEPFSLWVIEDFDGARPSWERAGALIVPDTTRYEAMKLRIVNAAHSALAALGVPRGHETVADAMADPELRDFVTRLLREELVPTVPDVPGIDLDDFVSRTLERFANPRLGHRLAQIAAGAEHKIPQRFGPPADELRAAGREPELIDRVVAAAGA
jgi:fructuronate reductase